MAIDNDVTIRLPRIEDPFTGPISFPGPRTEARPAPPMRGATVRLRRLIGVREDVLDWVPEDRPRYTWYGVIVVNTALLAGVSMLLVLSTVRSEIPVAVRIGVAVFWCWFVLGLDGWLVSSTHGRHRWRLLALLPRLVLSVLLSLFIAEPILMQIFDPEIQHQIAQTNQKRSDADHSTLVVCNPTDGSDTSARRECDGYRLQVAVLPPVKLRQEIDQNNAAIKDMQSRIDGINATLQTKTTAEQVQCARDHWIWFSNNLADVSQTCKDIRNDIAAYKQSNNAGTFQNQLNTLTAESLKLGDQARTADADYANAIKAAIDAKWQSDSAEQDSRGLLTRADALQVVAAGSWFAGFIAVMLHLILIVLDAMPVLAKLMNGPTEYDKALSRRMEANHRHHAGNVALEDDRASTDREFFRHVHTEQVAARRQRVDDQRRLDQEERARRFRAELDARATRIMRGGEVR